MTKTLNVLHAAIFQMDCQGYSNVIVTFSFLCKFGCKLVWLDNSDVFKCLTSISVSKTGLGTDHFLRFWWLTFGETLDFIYNFDWQLRHHLRSTDCTNLSTCQEILVWLDNIFNHDLYFLRYGSLCNAHRSSEADIISFSNKSLKNAAALMEQILASSMARSSSLSPRQTL